ncbi:MAG TPA: EAL domain-containing protein [Candidatus Dormibacteraeota bacterium]
MGGREVSPAVRLRLFGGGLLVAAVAVAALTLPHLGPPPSSIALPWPLLAVFFALAEIFIVDLHFRRDANSLTLRELPLVVGLFTLTVAHLLLAQILGAAVALVAWRRQPPLKLLVNLSLLFFTTTIAAVLFHALPAVGPGPVPQGWMAGLAAAMTQSALFAVGMACALALANGADQLGRIRAVLAVSVPASVVNASLALITVRLLENDRVTLWLVIVPAGFVLIGYRAYTSERRRSERAEFLNTTARLIERSGGLDTAVRGLLRGAREVFNAEMALIYVEADGSGEPPFQLVEGRQVPPTPDLERVLELMRAGAIRSSLLWAGDDEPAGGMVAALAAGSTYFGHILVGDPHPAASGLQEGDRRLLETLAAQASIAIENDRLERALIDRAYHDALTGLANRAEVLERTELALRRRGSESSVAVIFLDLDDFKLVNDSLGHAAGDDLLVLVADRLRNCVRPSDVAARLGGDEFAIMVEVRHGAAEAVAVAERVIGALQEPFVIAEREVAIRGSAGVALADERPRTAVELLRDADVAMYRAKAQGKGGFKVFEASMKSDVADLHRLKADLQRALDSDELTVVYQPIVRVDSGEVVGAEALARWRHPERGLVEPADFVPLAAELGIAELLGRRVLEIALAELSAWSALRGGMVMSVNIAARQLAQPSFAWLAQAAIARAGVDPRQVILEVTESVMAGVRRDNACEQLGELRRLGVRIAIDDFGTGSSSLALLHALPVDIIKVATPFIDAIDEGEHSLAFVNAICCMSETLGLQTIAEGVERPSQLERVRSVRCTLAQGYLLGRPMAGAAIRELLRTLGSSTAAAG